MEVPLLLTRESMTLSSTEWHLLQRMAQNEFSLLAESGRKENLRDYDMNWRGLSAQIFVGIGGGLEFEEVFQQAYAPFGCVGFRMKLDAPDRKRLVAEGHDLAFFGVGGHFQAVGERLALDEKRVVAGGGERVFDVLEKFSTVVANRGRFSMHEFGSANDFSAEMLGDALVPEADAEERHFSGKGGNHREADSSFAGGTGTGRDHEAIRVQGESFFGGDFVAAEDPLLLPELPEALD